MSSFHRFWRNGLALLAMGLALALPATLSAAQAGSTRYTGRVSDSMCGRTHDMGYKSKVACVRACVKGGSSYALVVGQRTYTLVTSNPQQVAALYKYADQRVVVTGRLNGAKLTVQSVAPAR